MSHEMRRFVDGIADMGFSRARVARTAQKLGQDDKKVSVYGFCIECVPVCQLKANILVTVQFICSLRMNSLLLRSRIKGS